MCARVCSTHEACARAGVWVHYTTDLTDCVSEHRSAMKICSPGSSTCSSSYVVRLAGIAAQGWAGRAHLVMENCRVEDCDGDDELYGHATCGPSSYRPSMSTKSWADDSSKTLSCSSGTIMFGYRTHFSYVAASA